jgi:hypothetical protein
MALHEIRRQLKPEHDLLIPEDGQRREILDGEHRAAPSSFLRHRAQSSSPLFA